jgi:hypothetical protein
LIPAVTYFLSYYYSWSALSNTFINTHQQSLNTANMRASTASMILAFCAVVAVQAAPTSINSGSVIARGTNDFEYDAQGNESKLVFV